MTGKTTEEKLKLVNAQLERSCKAIAGELQAILDLATDDAAVARHASETTFAYLHEQAAELEVMMLAMGVDEDVVNALVDSYRGDVPARLQAMRDSIERVMTRH